jgi:ribosomal protein S6--L-glutamate ligase
MEKRNEISIIQERIDHSKTIIGWKEWLSLPDLGIFFIKAKIDSGARTSALHASSITIKYERGHKIACFTIKPLPNRPDILVECEAPVIDERVVSDSSGNREKRFVIKSMLQIGGREWPIEMTLANREKMSVKMLLGREAMKYLMVDPTRVYLLGRPKNILKTYRTQALKIQAKNLAKPKKKKSSGQVKL